jgi:hypothetical protein
LAGLDKVEKQAGDGTSGNSELVSSLIKQWGVLAMLTLPQAHDMVIWPGPLEAGGRPVITNAFGFPDHQKSDLRVKIAFEQEADLEEAKLVGDNASTSSSRLKRAAAAVQAQQSPVPIMATTGLCPLMMALTAASYFPRNSRSGPNNAANPQ